MAETNYVMMLTSFLVVGLLGLAFIGAITSANASVTSTISVFNESLASYGAFMANTLAFQPLAVFSSVHTRNETISPSSYSLGTDADTGDDTVTFSGVTQASTLELVAPHANMAAYYPFTSNSPLALDGANGLNNATKNSVSWSSDGKYGGGIVFNDTAGYMNKTNTPSLNLTKNATFIVWAKLANRTNGHSFIEKPTYHQQYEFAIASDSKLALNWRAPDIQTMSSDTALDNATYIGSWHMFAVSVNCNTGEATFYIDAVSDGIKSFNSSQCIGDAAAYTTGELRLGMRSTDQTNNFTGSMDEVRIYNRALSAAEIKEQYDAYAGSPYKADYTYLPSGSVQGTDSVLLYLIPTFVLIALLFMFWKTANGE